LHGPNIWPPESRLPGFRDAIESYFKEMQQLSYRLLRLFAIALGLQPTSLDSYFSSPMMFLRPLRYAPIVSAPSEGVYGAGAHSDYGMLTILKTDEIPGLEILRNGSWLRVEPIPDTFIINLGDMFQKWSNNRFKSTVHRVVNRLGLERFSLPFFFEPRFDARLEPLIPPRSKSDNGPEIPPSSYDSNPSVVTAGEYLLSKYRGTHAGYIDAHKQ
jgi:isopenicillin N synthase-like dioxygenase